MPFSFSTPTTGWRRMRCRSLLTRSTHRLTQLLPPAELHSPVQHVGSGPPPVTSWNGCWCATCSPMAAICCSAARPCMRLVISFPTSHMARIGNSGSASRCRGRSPQRRGRSRCYSSGTILEARFTASPPSRLHSSPAWMRCSPIRPCSPASARGGLPQSGGVPTRRTIGSSAAN